MEKFVFNESNQTILLSLNKEVVDLDNVKNFALVENLLPKHEFHITIIGSETGQVLSKIGTDYDAIKSLAVSINWEFSFKKDFYYIIQTVQKKKMRFEE